MHDVAPIIAIVIGIPVIGGLIIALLRGWRLKAPQGSVASPERDSI